MADKFNTQGGYFSPQNYFKVDAGGSHAENPNGGVQIGTDTQGIPNMLEEGEPVYDDYVYSDNIVADEEFLAENNLPTKYAGMLYSDIADDILEEAEDRPLDNISNNGLRVLMGRLANAQEQQKQAEQEGQLQQQLADLSSEEMAALQQQLSAQQTMPEGQDFQNPYEDAGMEPALTEQQMPVEQPIAQDTAIPSIMSQAAQQPYAIGGWLKRLLKGSSNNTTTNSENNSEPSDNYIYNTGTNTIITPDGTEVPADSFGQQPLFYDSETGQAYSDSIPMRVDDNGELVDVIDPAIVTGDLQDGMTQEEARNRMEGYLFGQQVAQGRDAAMSTLNDATFGVIPFLNMGADIAERDPLGFALDALTLAGIVAPVPNAGTLAGAAKGAQGVVKTVKNGAKTVKTVKKGAKAAKTATKVVEDIPSYEEIGKTLGEAAAEAWPKKPIKTFGKDTGKAVSDWTERAGDNWRHWGKTGKIGKILNGLDWAVFPGFQAQHYMNAAARANGAGWAKRYLWPFLTGSGIEAVKGYGIGLLKNDLAGWTYDPQANFQYGSSVEKNATNSDIDEDYNDSNYANGGRLKNYFWQGGNSGYPASGYSFPDPAQAFDKNGKIVLEDSPAAVKTDSASSTKASLDNAANRYRASQVAKGNLLPTGLRYAEVIPNAVAAINNAAQRPDRYNIRAYTPVLPDGNLALQNYTYTPIDQNSVVNDVLAAGAQNARLLVSSGAGPATAGLLLANNYNTQRNIGNGLLQAVQANNQMRNDVIGRNNTNAQAIAQYDNAINTARANAINTARIRNMANALQQQLNYAAEAQKAAAVQAPIDNIAGILSKTGRENFDLNRLAKAGYAYRYNPFSGEIEYIPVEQG